MSVTEQFSIKRDERHQHWSGQTGGLCPTLTLKHGQVYSVKAEALPPQLSCVFALASHARPPRAPTLTRSIASKHFHVLQRATAVVTRTGSSAACTDLSLLPALLCMWRRGPTDGLVVGAISNTSRIDRDTRMH